MASEILQLAELISKSAKILVQTCEDNKIPVPSLNDAFHPASEAFRGIPACADAANIIVAATSQLAAAVASPPLSIFSTVAGHFRSAALRVCLETNVTEILREAGPQGLHIDDIAAQAGVDSMKLGRLLRVLCNHNVYREVTPEIFTNTRISSVLDTGKSVKQLVEKPEEKHEGTPGFAAIVELHLGDAQKASAYILENMKDPKTSKSAEPNQAPFHRVFDVDVPIWVWYERPEQNYRRARFGIAMHAAGMMQPPDVLLKALNWKSLPKGATVVDVGGGIGTSSLLLARTFPEIKFIIQDFPEVTEEGKKHWSKEFPEAIDNGRVIFQPHDFFTPQPVKEPSVFVLKLIMHDWSDSYASKILVELRKVAAPDTKLVVIDSIVAYTCHDPSAEGEGSIPGAAHKNAPAPLLANFGVASEISHFSDMAMMVFLNSQERTIGHLNKLLEKNGWRIIQAHRADPPSNFFEPVVATPIDGFKV